MRRDLAIAVLSCFAVIGVAQQEGAGGTRTLNEIQLRAKVQAVVPLNDFSGKVLPVGIDPHFALTMRIASVSPSFTDFNPPDVVTFAIHSPAIVFAGDFAPQEIVLNRIKPRQGMICCVHSLTLRSTVLQDAMGKADPCRTGARTSGRDNISQQTASAQLNWTTQSNASRLLLTPSKNQISQSHSLQVRLRPRPTRTGLSTCDPNRVRRHPRWSSIRFFYVTRIVKFNRVPVLSSHGVQCRDDGSGYAGAGTVGSELTALITVAIS